MRHDPQSALLSNLVLPLALAFNMKAAFSAIIFASVAAARQVPTPLPSAQLPVVDFLCSSQLPTLALSRFGMCHHPQVASSILIRIFRPAVFTDLNVGSAVPDVATGWEGKRFLVSRGFAKCPTLCGQHRQKVQRRSPCHTTGNPAAFGDGGTAISRNPVPVPA